MTSAAVRRRSLALVLERLLARGTATRGSLERETGLSKATVARLVADLERAGLAEPRELAAAGRPGRPSTGLAVPRALGHVVGLSLGLRSAYAVALDLAGGEAGSRLEATPDPLAARSALAWAAGFVAAAAEGDGPLLGVCVALPGRVRDGRPLAPLPAPLAEASGVLTSDALTEATGVPWTLATDADMALAGATARERVEPDASAVLFTMSTALTVATRTRLGTLEARTAALGDFAALPLPLPGRGGPGGGPGPLALGDLLSVRGLQRHGAALGIDLSDPAVLWTGSGPLVARIRDEYAEALCAAIRVAAVTTDPEVCVLAGRLAPLAAAVLPALRRRLAAVLDDPPRLVVADGDDSGRTTATGAARTALDLEQRRLVGRVREGERG